VRERARKRETDRMEAFFLFDTVELD